MTAIDVSDKAMLSFLFLACTNSLYLSLMEADNGGNNSSHASKQRLRWTHELHDRFVDAVAQLGGPDSEFPFLLFAFLRLYSVSGNSL